MLILATSNVTSQPLKASVLFDCVYLTMSAEEFSYRTIIMRRRCGVTVTPASSTNDLLTVLIYLSAAVAVHANGADNSRQPG